MTDQTAQHPAAPETDVSALTEAERESLRTVMGDIAGHPFVTVVNEVERILRERLRVVEGERDAAQALLDRHWMRYCLCSRADQMHDRSQPHCPHHGKPRYWQTRAESAEAARDALRAGIEALRPVTFALGSRGPTEMVPLADVLALLPGDGR